MTVAPSVAATALRSSAPAAPLTVAPAMSTSVSAATVLSLATPSSVISMTTCESWTASKQKTTNLRKALVKKNSRGTVRGPGSAAPVPSYNESGKPCSNGCQPSTTGSLSEWFMWHGRQLYLALDFRSWLLSVRCMLGACKGEQR
ncbi:hypothetical protein D6D24_10774 [Aureobasidium pullulans]|uniref:Uncharacterized protein n=1 Tax=Aureobasidium pullulans TaxID=5580 RepID=A0A4S8UVP8_AURPU|nr:hypothetical protein D6D24_10774 [Aureobasidium pullulans]